MMTHHCNNIYVNQQILQLIMRFLAHLRNNFLLTHTYTHTQTQTHTHARTHTVTVTVTHTFLSLTTQYGLCGFSFESQAEHKYTEFVQVMYRYTSTVAFKLSITYSTLELDFLQLINHHCYKT